MIKQRPNSLTPFDSNSVAPQNLNQKKMQAESSSDYQEQSCCCPQVCCSVTPGGGSALDIAVGVLWLLTPVTATLSLVIMCVAVGTNQWLHSEEKMPNSNYNGTGERIYLSKHTVSGLWTLCYTNPGERELQCFNIDYFPREEYSPDPNDSTMAIPYAVTKSAVFYFLATIFLFVGEFCCCFGHFARQRRVFTFISGIIFIISGLLVLIGLVMYISVFKAEIGSKLRPRSSLQPPLFTYRYGFSFVLVVSGFMSTEVAGTCAIFLYIYSHQLEWSHKSINSNNIILTVPPPPHLATIRPCQRHHLYRPNDLHFEPNYASSRENRYIGTTVTSPVLPPPPPSITRCSHYATMPRHRFIEDVSSGPSILGIRSHSQGNLNRDYNNQQQQQQNMSRDVTCNTISTTADVISNNSQHEFVTFNNELTRDSYSYETLRKTTPV